MTLLDYERCSIPELLQALTTECARTRFNDELGYYLVALGALMNTFAKPRIEQIREATQNKITAFQIESIEQGYEPNLIPLSHALLKKIWNELQTPEDANRIMRQIIDEKRNVEEVINQRRVSD